MRRKFLSVVLCVCMMLTMVPFAFAAGSDDTSTTNTQEQAPVANSSSSGSGGSTTSVSLPNDNTGNLTISTNNAVLDGRGLTYTNGTITVTAANVTIQNLTFGDKAALVVNTTGEFTLTGCTFTPTTTYAKGSNNQTLTSVRTAVTLNVGEAVVTNNTFDGVTGGYYNAIEFGINGDGNNLSHATITGNTFNSAIQNNYFNFYNMTEGATIDIESNHFLLANKGSNAIRISNFRNVSGVTFNVNNNEYTYANDSDESQYEGFILLEDYSPKGDTVQDFSGITININNLTSPSNAKQLFYVYDDQDRIIARNQPIVKGDSSISKFCSARIGDTYYASLANAVAAAQPSVATTITMLKDVNLPNYITVNNGKDITLDLNKHNIIFTGYSVFRVKGANFHVTGEGTIFENQKDGYAPIIAGGSEKDIPNYTTITIDKDVILKGDYAGIFVDTDNGGKDSYNNYGLIINMNGSIDLTAITDGVSAYGIYVQGLNKVTTGNVMQINLDGARIKTGEEAIYAAGYAKWNLKDCTFTAENAAIELRAGEMTIDGGNYTATATEFNCEANGNGSTTQGAALAIAQHTTKKDITVNIKDGTFVGVKALNESNPQENDPSPQVNLSISNGKFKGEVTTADVTKFISGGYFTTDPTAYLATGKTAVESDLAGYNYKVADKTSTPATVAAATPTVDTSKISETQQQTATEIANQLKADNNTVSGDGLTAAASTIANNNTVTTDQGKTALNDQNISAETSNTRIVVQTYMDIDITAIDSTSDKKTLTLDITPMYRTVATTATNDAEIILAGSSTTGEANAVPIGPANKLVINKPVTVKIPLPTNFVTANNDGSYSNVYVQHKGHEYTATVTQDTTSNKLIATFTNPDGFSEFTISKDPVAVATIGQNRYTTLQDAVDAVKDNETINVTGTGLSATVSGSKTFKVTGQTVNLSAASGYSLTNNGDTYTVSHQSSGGPSSSGGSISTPTTYAVNVNAATNGTVAADKKTASKGTTVTVTASPSKGYVVDAVKVVDKDGKDVAVTGKDGKYVFTMPASAVTVTGSFKAETPAPVALPFTDVKSGNWFYDAVQYAYAQGLMTGTSATTFAPNGTMNRAMIVTVLYRLEKSPAVTGASKFTDVPAGQWYSDAVAWAAANKIVNGYDETTFGPMNAVTREQMAAILFRYEQVKGLENVTLEENLNRFPDQNKISAYAIPALQWAVGQKIINGNADGTLDPTGTATRAQVAQIFTNLLNK